MLHCSNGHALCLECARKLVTKRAQVFVDMPTGEGFVLPPALGENTSGGGGGGGSSTSPRTPVRDHREFSLTPRSPVTYSGGRRPRASPYQFQEYMESRPVVSSAPEGFFDMLYSAASSALSNTLSVLASPLVTPSDDNDDPYSHVVNDAFAQHPPMRRDEEDETNYHHHSRRSTPTARAPPPRPSLSPRVLPSLPSVGATQSSSLSARLGAPSSDAAAGTVFGGASPVRLSPPPIISRLLLDRFAYDCPLCRATTVLKAPQYRSLLVRDSPSRITWQEWEKRDAGLRRGEDVVVGGGAAAAAAGATTLDTETAGTQQQQPLSLLFPPTFRSAPSRAGRVYTSSRRDSTVHPTVFVEPAGGLASRDSGDGGGGGGGGGGTADTAEETPPTTTNGIGAARRDELLQSSSSATTPSRSPTTPSPPCDESSDERADVYLWGYSPSPCGPNFVTPPPPLVSSDLTLMGYTRLCVRCGDDSSTNPCTGDLLALSCPFYHSLCLTCSRTVVIVETKKTILRKSSSSGGVVSAAGTRAFSEAVSSSLDDSEGEDEDEDERRSRLQPIAGSYSYVDSTRNRTVVVLPDDDSQEKSTVYYYCLRCTDPDREDPTPPVVGKASSRNGQQHSAAVVVAKNNGGGRWAPPLGKGGARADNAWDKGKSSGGGAAAASIWKARYQRASSIPIESVQKRRSYLQHTHINMMLKGGWNSC